MAVQRIFSRGPLTDNLISYLTTGLSGVALSIGDGIAPPTAGWQGTAGSGNFTAYAVVNAGNASPNFTDNERGRQTSWKQPYSLTCVGGSRQQCDWASDTLKPLIETYWAANPAPGPKALNLDDPWKILRSQYTALGAPSRNDQVDPPVWQATDSLVLFLEHATI